MSRNFGCCSEADPYFFDLGYALYTLFVLMMSPFASLSTDNSNETVRAWQAGIPEQMLRAQPEKHISYKVFIVSYLCVQFFVLLQATPRPPRPACPPGLFSPFSLRLRLRSLMYTQRTARTCEARLPRTLRTVAPPAAPIGVPCAHRRCNGGRSCRSLR